MKTAHRDTKLPGVATALIIAGARTQAGAPEHEQPAGPTQSIAQPRRNADGMMVRRLIAALGLLCFGLALSSCSSVSGAIADHWPHWAGGMPNDVPPRPGAPGYEEFIAHRQPAPDETAQPAGGGEKATTAPAPPAGNPPPPLAAPPRGEAGVSGGLY